MDTFQSPTIHCNRWTGTLRTWILFQRKGQDSDLLAPHAWKHNCSCAYLAENIVLPGYIVSAVWIPTSCSEKPGQRSHENWFWLHHLQFFSFLDPHLYHLPLLPPAAPICLCQQPFSNVQNAGNEETDFWHWQFGSTFANVPHQLVDPGQTQLRASCKYSASWAIHHQ